MRFGSLPGDKIVHPRHVHSAMGSPGLPIMGVVSVLT